MYAQFTVLILARLPWFRDRSYRLTSANLLSGSWTTRANPFCGPNMNNAKMYCALLEATGLLSLCIII